MKINEALSCNLVCQTDVIRLHSTITGSWPILGLLRQLGLTCHDVVTWA